MRFKCCILLAAGCVSLLALNTSALGNPASQTYAERVIAASKPIFGWPDLVKEARKYIGTNPTDRKRLWCATFMNLILANLGYPGTNSDAAKSFAYYGRRISKPEVGAIAVLTRGKRGGHVGVVSGVDANGNPVIISGNHNRRVGVAVYPRTRVIAYVMPTGRHSAGRPSGQAIANTAVERGTAGPSQQTTIESPIAELLAVINAEGNRPEAPRRQSVQPVTQPPPRAVQQPYRVVQQLPEQRAQPRDITLPPALADLFGLRDQTQSVQ